MFGMRPQTIRAFLVLAFVTFSMTACSGHQQNVQVEKDNGGWLSRAWSKVYSPERNINAYSYSAAEEARLKQKVLYLDEQGLPQGVDPRVSTLQPIAGSQIHQPSTAWRTISNYDQKNFIMPEQRNAYSVQVQQQQYQGQQQSSLPWQTVGDLRNIQEKQINDHGFGARSGVEVFPFEETIVGSSHQSQQASTHVSRSASTVPQIKGSGLAYTVYYKHGQKGLTRSEVKQLQAIAQQLKAMRAYHVRVIGHSSKKVYKVHNPTVKRMINLDVAMKRATLVSKELIRAGLNPKWVETIAWGDAYPNPVRNGKSSSADRRVEVFLVQR